MPIIYETPEMKSEWQKQAEDFKREARELWRIKKEKEEEVRKLLEISW